jgi:hypothetical protein
MIRADPFSFRDFIQYILPALIGVYLFIPYVASIDSIDAAFVSAAIFGYVLATPISSIARAIFGLIPGLRNRIKQLSIKRQWWSRNWNYDRLFYMLTKDERDYLYLTGAYVEFYRTVSVCFLIYSLLQIFSLTWEVVGSLQSSSFHWNLILDQQTPMLGGWEMSTLVLAVISLVAFYYLVADFLLEYEILFLDDGQYVTMAVKYQESVGGIAKSVWGCLLEDEAKPVEGATVYLGTKENPEITKSITDRDGLFQLSPPSVVWIKSPCFLRIVKDDLMLKKEISRDPKEVPYYRIGNFSRQAVSSRGRAGKHRLLKLWPF